MFNAKEALSLVEKANEFIPTEINEILEGVRLNAEMGKRIFVLVLDESGVGEIIDELQRQGFRVIREEILNREETIKEVRLRIFW